MGRFLRIYAVYGLLLILMTVYVTETIHQEKRNSRHGLLKKGRTSSERLIELPGKLPRVIQRTYRKWEANPENVTSMLHSIPLEVQHIKDDVFHLSAPYRNSKLKLLKVQLWLEFPSITKSNKRKFRQYLIDVTPAIGSGPKGGYYGACTALSIITKCRFPDSILEMKLDITSLYKSCKDGDNYEYFRLKFRLYCFQPECEDIDMTKDVPDAFLIFKEHDELEDLMEVIPEVEPLDHNSVMQMPQTRFIKYRVKNAKRCSLRPYTFSFIDSGWAKNIYFPHQFRSNMCKGRCSFPLAGHMNATNYAILRAIDNSMHGNVRNPCCVAQDLAPLAMIVHDEGQITLKVQKNMIARSCRCA